MSSDGQVTSLGKPTNIETKFTATIKDCMEGAKNTIEGSCTHIKLESKVQCYFEKFIGPIISWKRDKRKIILMYSPDPSVRLKVVGEKKHRYCHVVESIKF